MKLSPLSYVRFLASAMATSKTDLERNAARQFLSPETVDPVSVIADETTATEL